MDRNLGHRAVYQVNQVALRKESVDRNIIFDCAEKSSIAVALRKESVDRNLRLVHVLEGTIRRSPQGERG